MSEAFLGQILLVPYMYAPRNWSWCSGNLIDVNNNQSLFALLGTLYGGDGRVNFALPDLRARIPLGATSTMGRGPGLSEAPLAQKSGAETVTLTSQNLPNHNHDVKGSFEITGGVANVPDVQATVDTGLFQQTSGVFNQTGYTEGTAQWQLKVANQRANDDVLANNDYIGIPHMTVTNEDLIAYIDNAPANTLVNIDGVSYSSGSDPMITGTVEIEGTVTLKSSSVAIPERIVEFTDIEAGDAVTIGTTGMGERFNSLGPVLAMGYIIALQGLFPPRS